MFKIRYRLWVNEKPAYDWKYRATYETLPVALCDMCDYRANKWRKIATEAKEPHSAYVERDKLEYTMDGGLLRTIEWNDGITVSIILYEKRKHKVRPTKK